MDWLKEIDWKSRDGKVTPSRFKLLKEYLARAAKWANLREDSDAWPFGNLALNVQSNASPNPVDLAVIGGLPISTREKIVLEHVSAWRSIDPAKLSSHGFPDPYEPLLHFFAEGGTLRIENRMFAFEDAMIPIGKIGDYLKV